MARYRGPVEKLERRLNADLGLKGERRLNGKSALEKRPFCSWTTWTKVELNYQSMVYNYKKNKKLKSFMVYLKNNSENTLKEAARQEGNTGANLITLIETRLDNVVFRMGFATTRANARQFVTHGHILVDGKKVDIPSFFVKAGQKLKLEKSLKHILKL